MPDAESSRRSRPGTSSDVTVVAVAQADADARPAPAQLSVTTLLCRLLVMSSGDSSLFLQAPMVFGAAGSLDLADTVDISRDEVDVMRQMSGPPLLYARRRVRPFAGNGGDL